MTAAVEPQVMTAAEIALATGGRVVGDGTARVRAIAPLDRAGREELSFLALARYEPLMADSTAGVVLVSPEFELTPGRCLARVVVPHPHDAMVGLIPRFYTPTDHPAGIHPDARIGRNVTLGVGVCIEAGAVVEDNVVIGARSWIATQVVIGAGTRLGDDCQIYPQVVTYAHTRLGDRCIVHSGSRLGSDGFGYLSRKVDGRLAHEKIPHVGRLVIGDDVEIGANCAIARGSVDDTVIGAGTKIDHLVHIAHNVRIGRLCLITAQVGFAGSVRVEDGVSFGGQAGVSGHMTIGAGARIAGQAGVISDVPAGEAWSGYPARPHKESLRASAALFKLPGLLRHIERLLERDKS